MRVLVTGAHGFIGHYACAALRARGHEVIACDRKPQDDRSFKDDRIAKLDATSSIHADLADVVQVERAFAASRPDVVCHLAGQYSIDLRGVETIDRYVDANIRSMLYVLDACKRHSIPRLVYASSMAAAPSSPGIYGASLRFREHAAAAFERSGLQTLGLRFGAVYGPMLRRDTDIFRALEQGLTRSKVRLSKGFSEPKEFVEVREAAHAVALACELTPTADDPAVLPVVARDHRRDLGELLELAGAELGITPTMPHGYQRKAKGPPPSEGLALYGSLGYVPMSKLEDGVKDLAQWAAGEIFV